MGVLASVLLKCRNQVELDAFVVHALMAVILLQICPHEYACTNKRYTRNLCDMKSGDKASATSSFELGTEIVWHRKLFA
jgi:hypothetical protein